MKIDREYAEECLKEMEREKEEKIKAFEALNKDSSIEELEAFCEIYYSDITEEEIFEEYKDMEKDNEEERETHDSLMRVRFNKLKEDGFSYDAFEKFFKEYNIDEKKYKIEGLCSFCGKPYDYLPQKDIYCSNDCKTSHEELKEILKKIESDHCNRIWNGFNRKKSLSLRNEEILKQEEKLEPNIRAILKKSKKKKEKLKTILLDTSIELPEFNKKEIIYNDEYYKNYLIESIKNHMEMEEFYEQQRERDEERYKTWQLECQLSGQGKYECCGCGETFSLANLIAENHNYEVYCKRCLYKEEEEYIEKIEDKRERIIKEIRERIGLDNDGFGASGKYFKKCHTKAEKGEIIKEVIREYGQYKNEEFWKELEKEISGEIFCEEEEQAEGNLDNEYNFDEIETLE